MYGSPSLEKFHTLTKDEHSILVEELWDAPKALLLKLLGNRNIIVISSELRESKIIDDAPYFGLTDFREFPSWETLPGEEIQPSPDIIGRRLEILSSPPRILLCPLQAALQAVPHPKILKPLCHHWKTGDNVSFSKLPTLLENLGYRRVPVVTDKGEYAVRGGLIDLFPLASFDPYRLDFFGDTLETIRTFDPVTQKSNAKVDSLFLSPANEPKLVKENPAHLFDYFDEKTIIIFDDLLALEDKYVAFQRMPHAHFSAFEELLKKAIIHPHIFWTKEKAEELSEVIIDKKVGRAYFTGETPFQPLTFQIMHTHLNTKRWHHPFQRVDLFTTQLPHFICATDSEERMLKEKLGPISHAIWERGYLSSGIGFTDSNIALIPTATFTNRPKIRRQKWRTSSHTPASEFHELLPGDLVVHFHHGIGKYLGLEKQKNHLGAEGEFLVLEYAENSKLFVPISQAYLVSRYIGSSEESPPLHAIGGKSWSHAKISAQKSIVGYAQDLLRMSAERELKGGFQFPQDSADMISFENDFPYVETDDQLQAIAAIKDDMIASKAMDRLICGDVGYGKTEVAMRAAFKAAAEGKKQVAVLVPTTVLAMQHFDTFCERMANYPLIIKCVSRFQSPKEVRATLADLKEGKVDILIGTHRLISSDVQFKDLGLIIIDEEQRFGVRAKEHLKKLKIGVDCLTLSATPIPRTLYLSLVGAKNISVINTPPQDRLPIKTILSENDSELVKNALIRELSRDGQAFFIHNRVESISLVQNELQKLVPEARMAVVHGQMPSDLIDDVFHAFKKGDVDVLIATTIIENGIDIPNANTILIDSAHKLGLADLYQMRGRVGRWNRPAYAYFLTPKGRSLPEISQRRLKALAETQGRGGGMKIAMRDLEIRGAGDMLGTQQSGQVASIGFHLYCKLLKRTIEALKKQAEPTFIETKIEAPFDARLPDTYVSETALRLEIYHRLGDAQTPDAVTEIISELIDRFGPIPPPVAWLAALTRIRILAAQKKIAHVKFTTHTLTLDKQTFSCPPLKTPTQLEDFFTKTLN